MPGRYETANRPSAIDQAVDRSLRGRREAATNEITRLVDAALVLIQRSGQLEPRVSEIVEQAGLHNQAFYRHFRSKHELLVAVLDQGIALLAGYLAHRMERAASPVEQVRAWLAGVCEQALSLEAAAATRPFVLARGRLSEAYPEEVRESERQLSSLLRSAIRAGVASGDFPNADADRDSETLYLLAMGWVEHRLTDPQLARREDADALVAFAMAGLSRDDRSVAR
jgi:AcrR family transcriptional regulator